MLLTETLPASFLKLPKKKTHGFNAQETRAVIPPPPNLKARGEQRRLWGARHPACPRPTPPPPPPAAACLSRVLESSPSFLLPGLIASGLANFQFFAASEDQIFLINNKRFCWDQSCFPPSLCKPRQHRLRILAFQGASYYGGKKSPSWWVKSILSSLVTSVLTFKARKETR